MAVLCMFVSALLALSGISDTGKFLEETAKTFKMFEKPSSSGSNISKSEDNPKKGNEKENSCTDSSNSTVQPNIVSSGPESSSSVVVLSEDGVGQPKKKVTISEKIDNVSKSYNKNVLNFFKSPLQLQKLLYATAKPIAEFLGAGYVMCGYENKNGPFDWLDLLSGKPSSLLGLRKPSPPQQ